MKQELEVVPYGAIYEYIGDVVDCPGCGKEHRSDNRYGSCNIYEGATIKCSCGFSFIVGEPNGENLYE